MHKLNNSNKAFIREDIKELELSGESFGTLPDHEYLENIGPAI